MAAPVIESVFAISSSIIEVTISLAVENNAFLREPENYIIDGGLTVRKAKLVAPRVIHLYVRPTMVEDKLYNLTINTAGYEPDYWTYGSETYSEVHD